MASLPTDWAAATAYAVGDLANFNGVVYRRLVAGTTSAEPCDDTDNWIVEYVVRAEDWNSIIESVRLELNVDDDKINNSIPYFVQLTENSVTKKVRPPTNLVTTLRTIVNVGNTGYAGRTYIQAPTDLLNVENIRINSSNPSHFGLLGLGNVEITAAQSDADFEVVRQYYNNDNNIFGQQSISNFRTPLYRFITIGGIPYFEIAPSSFDVGTTLEIRYWNSEPSLGTVHPRINSLGLPINSAGQTSAEWVDAGNDEADFVQANVTIKRNWYTSNAPELIIYGALMKASAYLKDDQRAAIWAQQFENAEQETIDLIYRFEEVRPSDQQFYNPYSL